VAEELHPIIQAKSWSKALFVMRLAAFFVVGLDREGGVVHFEVFILGKNFLWPTRARVEDGGVQSIQLLPDTSIARPQLLPEPES
jgi:hypothetical protein